MKLAVVLLVLCVAAAAQDPNAARDAKLIAEVKSLPAQKLDEALPKVAVEKWLQTKTGADAKYHWEVNDCGEQTGSPTDSGPVPLCVEVDATLKDGREIVIFIADDRSENAKKTGPP